MKFFHLFFTLINAKFDRLPKEISDEIANFAMTAAEHTAQERFGSKFR